MTLVAVMSTWMPCCVRAFDFFARPVFSEPSTELVVLMLGVFFAKNLQTFSIKTVFCTQKPLRSV